MKTHNGKVITSGTKIAEGQVTGEEVRDASLSLADLDPSGGTAGQVPVINEAEDAVEWADLPSSGVSLSDANVFTALQTLSVSDGLSGTPTVCAVTRHTVGSFGGWSGVTHRLDVASGATVLAAGAVRARYHSDIERGSFTEIAPTYGGTVTACGLRCRAAEASCISAIEVVMAAGVADPVLQPCRETPPADLGMILRPIGSGIISTERLGLHSGTVAQITGGTGKFASPQESQCALATDANSGAGALAIYTGGAWKMATLAPLA